MTDVSSLFHDVKFRITLQSMLGNAISVKMGKINTPPHFGGKLHDEKLFIAKIRSIAIVENF